MHQPSAERDAVGLIIEFLRIEFVEMLQFLILQNLRVQGCHTIDAEAIVNVNVCHVHTFFLIDDIHGRIIEFPTDLVVKHLDNGH